MNMVDLVKVTEESFASDVLSSRLPVLVDFYADWCGPCRVMEPALKDVAAEFEGEAVIVKLDVEAHPATQEKYGVLGLPTLLLFKDGEVIDRLSGAAARSAISALIEKSLGD
jgi:thioredoxin 1